MWNGPKPSIIPRNVWPAEASSADSQAGRRRFDPGRPLHDFPESNQSRGSSSEADMLSLVIEPQRALGRTRRYSNVSRLHHCSLAVEARRFDQSVFPGEHASALRRPGYLHHPACANSLCRVRLPVPFPVRYEHNVVFHDSIFSSIFVTRLFATFSEIAYIFLFSHVLRLLNIDHVV